MSSVLFLCQNQKLRSRVEAALTAAGHEVTACDAADHVMNSRTFDCAIVDAQPHWRELVYQLIWVGTTCIVGVYHSEQEHLEQLDAGALWSIPSTCDVAAELAGGTSAVEHSIAVARMGTRPTGLASHDRMMPGMREFLRGFKNPRETSDLLPAAAQGGHN